MPRLSDAVLSGADNQHYNTTLDLKYGGQQAYAASLEQWVSTAAYVRRNVICILVEAPRGFSLLSNGSKYIEALRSLVETHAISITGLDSTLTVDVFENNPVGGAGQRMQDPNNVTRAVPNVQFRWVDRYGMAIARFLESWITTFIMDPDTKIAGLATMGLSGVTDLLPDMYAATMLFIEPDPTGTQVVKSWLGTNMYPLTSGPIEGSRDKTQAMQESTIEATFTGIYKYGAGLDVFSQSILNNLSLTGANPYQQQAFITSIDPLVTDVQPGYADSIAAVSEENASSAI